MFFTGITTPREAEKVGWKKSSEMSLGMQLTLLFVFRSVELVNTAMNSWNFQPSEFPDVLKLSLKDSYFTMCVFPAKEDGKEASVQPFPVSFVQSGQGRYMWLSYLTSSFCHNVKECDISEASLTM